MGEKTNKQKRITMPYLSQVAILRLTQNQRGPHDLNGMVTSEKIVFCYLLQENVNL